MKEFKVVMVEAENEDVVKQVWGIVGCQEGVTILENGNGVGKDQMLLKVTYGHSMTRLLQLNLIKKLMESLGFKVEER